MTARMASVMSDLLLKLTSDALPHKKGGSGIAPPFALISVSQPVPLSSLQTTFV